MRESIIGALWRTADVGDGVDQRRSSSIIPADREHGESGSGRAVRAYFDALIDLVTGEGGRTCADRSDQRQYNDGEGQATSRRLTLVECGKAAILLASCWHDLILGHQVLC